jgi:hypothetical protein
MLFFAAWLAMDLKNDAEGNDEHRVGYDKMWKFHKNVVIAAGLLALQGVRTLYQTVRTFYSAGLQPNSVSSRYQPVKGSKKWGGRLGGLVGAALVPPAVLLAIPAVLGKRSQETLWKMSGVGETIGSGKKNN